MSTNTPGEEVDRQLPAKGEIFLDHVGHFTADAQAAAEGLRRGGFAPTPPSIQVNPDSKGGEVRTGTGNVTAMLRHGYIEALFKTADTPLGRELDAARARYPGLHLIAFAVADAEAEHRRLGAAGFRTRPLVKMARPVDTDTGKDTAAFTVARVEPGEMEEGRIQMLTHWTEHAVWQPRWLDHPNGAIGLVDVVIASGDPAGAVGRFARFLDRPAGVDNDGRLIRLDRGGVRLVGAEAVLQLVPGLSAPSLPFIATYAVAVESLDTVEACLRQGDLPATRRGEYVIARFPESLGVGAWVFVEDASRLPWR